MNRQSLHARPAVLRAALAACARLRPAALLAAVVLAWLSLASPVASAQEEGVPVEVRVVDAAGNPIPTAVVRHPEEAERHRVNTVTGAWTGKVLYLPDGTALSFAKGMELTFEVSAPGYQTATVRYLVRKRKNVIIVNLDEMTDDTEAVDPMSITIQFGRDKPIDGASTAPPAE